MTIQQLEYFIEAARTLSFTKTAETFFISQSAVTQQVKNLEEELGVQLFQRRNNRINLTPAGMLLAQEAKSLLARTRDIIEKVQAVHNGLSGSISIGYLQCMEMNQFPTSVQSFHRKYPSVKINLFRGGIYDLRDMLLDGRLDVIFNIENDNLHYTANTSCRELKKYGYSVIVPMDHPLAQKVFLEQEDLRNEKLIIHNLHRNDAPSQDPIRRKFLKDELLDNVAMTENDIENIMIMVAAGMGVAVLPNFDTAKINNNLMLRAIPLDTGGYEATVCEYHLKDNENPLVELFLEEL